MATPFNFGKMGSSTPTSSSMFSGSNPATSTPSSGSGAGGALFSGAGNTNTISTTPLFNTNKGASLFGNTSTSTTPASGSTSIFGKPGASGSTGNTPTFSFGQKAAGETTGTSASNSGTPATTSLFSAPTGTPATNKTFSFPSTTPAGPPPGGSLFTQANQGTAGAQSAQSKPASTFSSATPGPFSGATSNSSASSLFNFPKPSEQKPAADANKPTQQTQQSTTTTPSPFSGAQNVQGAQATPSKSLFQLNSTTPTAPSTGSKPTLSFGPPSSSAQPSSSQAATTSAAPTSSTPFSFGNKPTLSTSGTSTRAANTSSAGPIVLSPGGTTGMFLNPGNKPPASSGATQSSATATSGVVSAPTVTTFPATTFAAPASGSAFSGFKPGSAATTSTQPATSTTTTVPAASTMATGTAGSTAPTSVTGGLGNSTTGPTPSAQSRLKNKSMDDIITRWAADLQKYQKEFQSQAAQVAAWDQALVQNSDKISKLFGKTFQAERDASEVENQLRLMEDQQDELDAFLDRYEKEVDDLLEKNNIKSQEGLRGPDQERERTYKLAEKLQDNLTNLNKDLTDMIEEINNVSQTLSKTGKPDDPLTKVVRVLNTHLSQLQLIDAGTNQLQEKIKAAQKDSQRVSANGWSGLGSDPTEDFYRSFRGGRTERFGGVS